MSLGKVFSGSCLSLDDHDYAMPRLVVRKHILGSGEDLFDEDGRPKQPQPRTINKVFSGSALDLNAMEDDSDANLSSGVSPATQAVDQNPNYDTQQSFNDFVDHRMRGGRGGAHPVDGPNAGTMVLVVGGAGYLASHVIAGLLRDGYQVRATLPDTRDVAKCQDLMSLVPEARHRLFLVEANMFSDVSLRSVLVGVRFAIHCGVTTVPEGQDVVDGHMKAVTALFDAVRATKGAGRGVERVVLTGVYTNVLSSYASKAPTPSGLYDESQWNDVATRSTDALAYARVMFEREAWRLSELCRVELVVMLPAIMLGPSRTLEVSEAMRTITEFANGSSWLPFVPNIHWSFVDVRDVAEAHLRAMTHPAVNRKRMIVSNCTMSLAELGQLIRKAAPHLKAPTYAVPTVVSLILGPLFKAPMRLLWRNLGVRRQLDAAPTAKELNLVLAPIESTVNDAVTSLIHDGHLPAAGDEPPAGSSTRVVLRLSAVVGIAAIGAAVWRASRRN